MLVSTWDGGKQNWEGGKALITGESRSLGRSLVVEQESRPFNEGRKEGRKGDIKRSCCLSCFSPEQMFLGWYDLGCKIPQRTLIQWKKNDLSVKVTLLPKAGEFKKSMTFPPDRLTFFLLSLCLSHSPLPPFFPYCLDCFERKKCGRKSVSTSLPLLFWREGAVKRERKGERRMGHLSSAVAMACAEAMQ